jgi:hypothetical protein
MNRPKASFICFIQLSNLLWIRLFKFLEQSQTHYVQAITYTINNWSNHVHSRHFSHYGFNIYPFPSAFHSMTVLQVASQIFISVITCCLWYMHPSLWCTHTRDLNLEQNLISWVTFGILVKNIYKSKLKQILFLWAFLLPDFIFKVPNSYVMLL